MFVGRRGKAVLERDVPAIFLCYKGIRLVIVCQLNVTHTVLPLQLFQFYFKSLPSHFFGVFLQEHDMENCENHSQQIQFG